MDSKYLQCNNSSPVSGADRARTFGAAGAGLYGDKNRDVEKWNSGPNMNHMQMPAADDGAMSGIKKMQKKSSTKKSKTKGGKDRNAIASGASNAASESVVSAACTGSQQTVVSVPLDASSSSSRKAGAAARGSQVAPPSQRGSQLAPGTRGSQLMLPAG